MSIQNILTQNDYTGYFENLNVSGNLVANNVINNNFTKISVNLDIVYSNGSRVVGTFPFQFTNNNGLISVLIPFFNDIGASGNTGYYTIDLTSSPLLADYLPGSPAYLLCVVSDNGVSENGNITFLGNSIQINDGLFQSGLFSGAGDQGLPFYQIFNYFNY